MAHEGFDHSCCEVACKVAGCTHEQMHAAIKAVDEGTVDPAELEGRAAIDLSNLFDLIQQLIEALIDLGDDCSARRMATIVNKPSRRLRNRIGRESRDFCSSCSSARFGVWVDKSEEISNAIVEHCQECSEDDLTASIQDAQIPPYVLI